MIASALHRMLHAGAFAVPSMSPLQDAASDLSMASNSGWIHDVPVKDAASWVSFGPLPAGLVGAAALLATLADYALSLTPPSEEALDTARKALALDNN